VIEWPPVSWRGASCTFFAIFACMCALIVGCQQIGVRSMSEAGIVVTAAIPALGQLMASIEDDESESQENDLEPSGLPGVRLVSPPSLTLSQITSSQRISLSLRTPAQLPLRC
jgi:hypothetical protein